MAGSELLRSRRTGSVIALVLFAVVLLVLSGVGVLSLGQTARVFSIRTAAEIAARTAADDGITKAIWQLNDNLKDGWSESGALPREDNTALPNSDATYSYIVDKANKYYGDIVSSGEEDLIDFVRSAFSTTPGAGDYVVRSIGRYHEAEKVIYATLRLVGCGDTGVLVRESITLKAGTLVDGRDSRDPTNPDPDVLVEIGTISTAPGAIVLNNGVTVNGNIQVGVGGVPTTVIKDLGAVVEGDKYAMTEEPEFPYIYPPAGLKDMSEIDIQAITQTIGPAQNGRYSLIRLKNGPAPTILEIAGGDVVLYVTGNIDMGQGSEIKIAKGATLNLYIDGNINAHEDSGFNNEPPNTPPSLKIWGNWRPDVTGGEIAQKWTINANSEYFGQIYAPSANLTVNAKGDLYGAFTANSFEMKSGGNLFYDGALRVVNPDDPGVRFVLKRWYEE